ncbi:helix-turn-helix domain-containing protein [Actinomadura adrarensis]|uniref:Helix-turn-helix domain-containing protein n=1 Tax=Actinomadura adrarensis TaxID=1819600 RepID=A0ABW3CSC4_9ACTN
MSGMRRLCSRCDQPLSRYTTGEVCGPCVAAGRGSPLSTIELPLGFWFSENIAQALAVWDWATVLQGVHRQTRATQGAIAQQTGLSQATVSRLMAGRSAGGTIETALKLLDGLGAPRILAGLAPRGLSHLTGQADEDSALPTGGNSGGRVKRREFTQRIVLAGLAIPLAGSGLPGSESVDVVDGLERPADVVADLYALDSRYGGASLVDLAEARLATLIRQLKHVTLKPAEEPFVHSVIGQVATAAAWFAYERGDVERADAFLKDGLYAAHGGGDTDLRLQVLNIMSMTANAADEPAKTIAIAQGALDAGGRVDPQLKALLTMRLALGHARVRHRREFEEAKAIAWDDLGRTPSLAHRAEWFRFFGEQEMHGLEAIGRIFLGDHRTAADLLEDATTDMLPRNRAYYSVMYSAALVRSGEVNAGIESFHRNLPLLVEMTSHRISDKVREFTQALAPYGTADAQETRRIARGLIGGSSHA